MASQMRDLSVCNQYREQETAKAEEEEEEEVMQLKSGLGESELRKIDRLSGYKWR